ncbi:MAG: hypothetical protein EXQ53_11685 [Acidobacteria bacterium]|nr:hypothetical protein [Acidobacteriota bacterium]
MEAGFQTPFLDIFKHAGVDRDIRLMAARGDLGLRADEQRSLLELLVGDPDPEIAQMAEAALKAESVEQATVVVQPVEPAPAEEEEEKKASSLEKIAAMNPAQRLALAMRGTREERGILIRDPNKIVATAVLSSPKVTSSEVEAIAKMANVSDEILRIIGNTRAWVKSYAVVSALTKNPKTPLAVSMNLLSRLSESDRKRLAAERNVPDVLRFAARKNMDAK